MTTHLDELPRIAAIAEEYAVDPLFLLAIRMQENGAAGKEFGVLSVAAPTWEAQCRGCAASVRNKLATFGCPVFELAEGPSVKRLRYNDNFIEWFSAIWAPQGVANDPTNLNANWLGGVTHFYLELIRYGGQPPQGATTQEA